MGGGEVVACNMARVLKDDGYRVIFACGKIISTQEIKDKLGIDLSDIEFRIVQDEQSLKQLTINYELSTINLFINISFMDYSYGIGKRNIYYVHFPSKIRSGLFNYVLLFFQKTNLHLLLPGILKERVDDRLRAGIYPDMKKRLNSYDTFITHSEYVKKWTKKLWNKDAQVLYPPVQLVNPLTREPVNSKHNWITSIGRFFTLGHGKKQEVMIEAFKQLVNSLTREPVNPLIDLQLHLIGGVGSEPSSIRFVNKLKEMAKGYPIFFHFNANRKEVEEILCKSKIYWHAAGFREDPERDPIKFEHFGIAPIEALSAGCIPVLFNGGGLTEIVELLNWDRTHHLFSTVDDLVDRTKNILMGRKKMVADPKTLNTLFSPLGFKEKFTKLIKD